MKSMMYGLWLSLLAVGCGPADPDPPEPPATGSAVCVDASPGMPGNAREAGVDGTLTCDHIMTLTGCPPGCDQDRTKPGIACTCCRVIP